MPAGGQVAAGLEIDFVALLEAYLPRCLDCECRIQLGGIIQFVASTGGYVLSRSLRSRLSLATSGPVRVFALRRFARSGAI